MKIVKTRTYKPQEAVDVVSISMEAEEFLKKKRLLFDPTRAVRAARTPNTPSDDDDDDDNIEDSPPPPKNTSSKRTTASRSTRPSQRKKTPVTVDDSKMTRLQKKQLVSLLDSDGEPDAMELPPIPSKRQNVGRSPIKKPSPVKTSTTTELEFLLGGIRSLREQLAVKESSTSSLARGNENIEAASGGNVGDQFAELLRDKAEKTEIPMKSSPYHADVSSTTQLFPLDAVCKTTGVDPAHSFTPNNSFRTLLESHFRDTYRLNMLSLLQRKDEEMAFQRSKYEDALLKMMPMGHF